MRGSRSRDLFALAGFAGAYYVAYRYGMSFSRVSASPFWFPDSALLCALLLSQRRRWWIFVLVTLPIRVFSEVARDIPLWFLLTTFAIDAAKGVLTAMALRRFIKDPTRFETLRDFALFCAWAVVLIPALSAFAGICYWSGSSMPCSAAGRGPKMRRSDSAIDTSLMLASRRRM